MSVTANDSDFDRNPRCVSRLAVASLLFVGISVGMMCASKQIELGEGWDRLGESISKVLMYIGSIFSIAVAFWCWMAAAVRHGVRRIDVGAAAAIWVSACAAYYVLYVWWPTPEMLVRAASRYDISRAKFCLDQGVDINSIASFVLEPDVKRRTALTAAVRANDLEVVDFLISNGADPNLRDGYHASPFELTSSWQTLETSWEVGDRLLRAGADINDRNSNNLTSLEQITHGYSSERLDFERCKLRIEELVARGAVITESARLAAMDRADLRLAKFVEDLRRHQNLPESNPFLEYLSALMSAEDDLALDILKQNAEWNGKSGVRTDKDLQPGSNETFRISIRFGRDRPVGEWLRGARASARDVKRDCERLGSAHIAATHGHVELLNLFDSFDVDLSSPRKPIGSPLACAARHGNLEAAEWLIEHGVDIGACLHPSLGDTALAEAVTNGHLKIVQLLVDRGADLTASHYGGSLFALAVRQNHPPVAAFLLSRGADYSGRFYESWVNEMLEDSRLEQ